MPGYALTPHQLIPAFFSVQEKHPRDIRDPLSPSAVEQLAEAVALGQPCFKKRRVASKTPMRRRIFLDVMETTEVFEVKADMPGVEKDNIKVEIDKGVLTLSVDPCHHPAVKHQNSATTQRCCASKADCSPSACLKDVVTQSQDAANAEAASMQPTNTINSQHAACPCGDKCGCNPCRCLTSKTGVAGCGPCQAIPGNAAMPPSGAEAGSVGRDVKMTATWHAAERSHRFQQRTIQIPEAVNVNNANATYTDGVLTVTFPKVATLSARTKLVIS